MTQPTKDEIQEILKSDPFIKHWRENYELNRTEGIFNFPNVMPMNYLKNIETNKQVPFLFIAAGPSLEKNIHLIKNYENKCMIVCADVTLSRVLEEGIKPDFVVTIDPNPEIKACWSDLKGNMVDTSNITLVAPTSTNTNTLKSWKGKIILFNQSDNLASPKGQALKQIITPTQGYGEIYNNFFVGATMLQFVSIFSPDVIILTGYDFAYTDNKVYCDGIVERKAAFTVDYNPERMAIYTEELREALLKLSNLNCPIGQEKIPTSILLDFYKRTFVSLVRKYKITVINSTEGGILTEVIKMKLENSLQSFCKTDINKIDLSKPKFRKRGKKK